MTVIRGHWCCRSNVEDAVTAAAAAAAVTCVSCHYGATLSTTFCAQPQHCDDKRHDSQSFHNYTQSNHNRFNNRSLQYTNYAIYTHIWPHNFDITYKITIQRSQTVQTPHTELELAATLRWFTAGGAIRIALRQLSQTWKWRHWCRHNMGSRWKLEKMARENFSIVHSTV